MACELCWKDLVPEAKFAARSRLEAFYLKLSWTVTFERRSRGSIAVIENKREAVVSFGGLATEVRESENYVTDEAMRLQA